MSKNFTLKSILLSSVITLNAFSANAFWGVIAGSVFGSVAGSVTKSLLDSSSGEGKKDLADGSAASGRIKNTRYVAGDQIDISPSGGSSVVINKNTYNVSAGEELNNGYRAWLKGALSSTKHDSDDKLAYSYKFLSKSIVLGADKILEDDSMLGIFYRYTDGRLKCDKDTRDNTDHGFSLRGAFNLTDQIGMVSAGTFARSKITGDSLPSGKTIDSVNIYNALNYSAKVGDYLTVKPKVGVEYMHFNRKRYASKDDMDIRGMMISIWDAYTGISLKSSAKIDELTYHIKLFGDLYHNISGSSSSLRIIFPQENVITELNEKVVLRSKTRWSLGASLGLWYMDRYKIKSNYIYSRVDTDSTHIGTITFAIEF
ncbi:autotransporter outer membrane beta-barrel domain-containing protein [Rickettsiaceae bacterium]|nr:autotransporter outer membrane beta-barrel domain-containing protein [Rickettsiaceae bacterium]